MFGGNKFLTFRALFEGWFVSVIMRSTLFGAVVLFLRPCSDLLRISMGITAACTAYTSRSRVISKSETAQQNDRLDDESYKTLLKTHLNMGCLDEAEKFTQEICTKGIRANGVTFNELLHARAFTCAGAGGRPWPMSPSAASGLLDRGKAEASSLFPLTLSKRMTETTISFGTTSVGLLATNGGENSWLLRKAALNLTSSGRPPSPSRCTATRACGTRQRTLPCHTAAREEAFRSPPHDCAIDNSTPLREC